MDIPSAVRDKGCSSERMARGIIAFMRLPDLIAYQKRRLRMPSVWIPALGLGFLLFLGTLPVLFRQLPSFRWIPGILAAGVYGFGTAALYTWLSPAPWLWTGTRASHAPILRGLTNAALFNGACIILLNLFQGTFLWYPRNAFGLGLVVGKTLSELLIHVPGAAALGYFLTLWERTRFVKEETEKKLREAHWVLLRGQLSPHVLFNALNGLAELVRQDPLKAEQAILDLADLYRALLDHGSRQWTPLREERRLVTRYLAIEGMRLGNRLETAWDWDEGLQEFLTPPFLIQPLVENALKHGISPNPGGGFVKVGLRQEGESLVITVANGGRPLPLVLGNGVGVGNLEARLFLAFGDSAEFKLQGDEQGTTAEIRIPLDVLRRHA